MRRFAGWPLTLVLLLASKLAWSGPLDIVLNPSPQEFENTCQSYSMALAVSLLPDSPLQANRASELRDLERRIRSALDARAINGGVRSDWRAALESATNGVFTLEVSEFAHVDQAMRFVAELTGVPNAGQLGPAISLTRIKTPAIISFKRVAKSVYKGSHIITVFGVELPPKSMTDDATPELLLTNSAVKYASGRKNLCAAEDLSDADPYRAITTRTSDYELTKFGGPNPYLVTWVRRK
jgi:hypothetical protein